MADEQNGDYTEDCDQGFENFEGDNSEFTEQPVEGMDQSEGAGMIKAKPDDDRKLFVGGLSWESTQNDLKEYFGTYGEIEDINIKTDPATGRSRGFAFIVFSKKESVDAVLEAGTHTINNKQVDPKRAKAKPGIKKIFVGGLDPEYPESDIRAYFEKYGKIEEIELPFDKQKNQRRQFCFITFESEEVVDEICKEAKQTIGDKECDIKKATPKLDSRPSRFGGGGGGRGGRGKGRGRGGYGGGWNQGGYGGGYGQYGGYGQGYGGYGGGYGGGYDYYGAGGYDYSGWGGQGSYGGYGQQSGYGKARRGGGGGYHPYSR